MIEVYIDESGNLGRDGKFFALAAVVFESTTSKLHTKREVRKMARRYKYKGELKSCRLPFAARQRLLTRLAQVEDLSFFYLIIHKPQFLLLQSQPKNLVYNYLARLLVDKIFEWYNEDFFIVFDQRSTRVESRNSLLEYIKISSFRLAKLNNRKIEVYQQDSKTSYELQAADLIVGTVCRCFIERKTHFMEILWPKIIYGGGLPGRYFRTFWNSSECGIIKGT